MARTCPCCQKIMGVVENIKKLTRENFTAKAGKDLLHWLSFLVCFGIFALLLGWLFRAWLFVSLLLFLLLLALHSVCNIVPSQLNWLYISSLVSECIRNGVLLATARRGRKFGLCGWFHFFFLFLLPLSVFLRFLLFGPLLHLRFRGSTRTFGGRRVLKITVSLPQQQVIQREILPGMNQKTKVKMNWIEVMNSSFFWEKIW